MDISNTALVLPALAATSTLGSLLLWWIRRIPHLSVWLLGISLVTGQLVRIPLPGQGGGLLLSDIAVILILISALCQMYRGVSRIPVRTTLFLLPFIFWSGFSLFLYASHLEWQEVGVAAAYWLRLTLYMLTIPALMILAAQNSMYAHIRRTFWVVTIALIILGYIQLFFIPDLSILGAQGWDPHDTRAVSTWLDPNFFGLYLVLWSIWLVLQFKRISFIGIFIGVVTLLLLAATRSRSSFLAAIGVITIATPFSLMFFRVQRKNFTHIWLRIIAISGIVIAWGLVAGFLLGPRLYSAFQYDPTVDLRITALQTVWYQLIQPHSFIGVGYNTYQFAAKEVTGDSNFMIHSRAGSDNSFFTLWVTTGVIGIGLFLLPWIYLCQTSLQKFAQTHVRIYAVIPLSLLAITIHSQIVNSFLYSHILLSLAFLIALTLMNPDYGDASHR